MTHMRRQHRTLAATLAILAVLALAIGARGVAAQEGSSVSIVDFAFQPASVEVAAGSTVTWTNSGAVQHTVTADDGSFDSGNLAPGASFSQTFDSPGAITYHCTIHPQMTGTITVTGAGGGTQAAPAQQTTQVAQVPRTGVGTMASTPGIVLALLAALTGAVGAAGARVVARRV